MVVPVYLKNKENCWKSFVSLFTWNVYTIYTKKISPLELYSSNKL